MNYQNTLSFAQEADQQDPLRKFRNEFYIPTTQEGKEKAYFTGNSLGLEPKRTEQFLKEELEDWKNLGVDGHFDAGKKRPWFHYHQNTKKILSDILGAKPIEIVSMNTLTVNLHLMMVSFYRPEGKRYKIMAEAGAFPSDQYAMESQLRFHGYDPEDALIELSPREGENLLRTEDILAEIKKHGEEIALVLLGGIQYYTGQFFELGKITAAAHEVGATMGVDLAHAAGNVPLKLHDWDVDFAVWCSYKYMNAGPGGMSGIFVNERFAKDNSLPRFAGWWGHDEEARFQMKKGFIPMEGADGWQLSNVNILPATAHLAALTIFEEAGGIQKLREKSLKLTGYLEFLLKEITAGQHIVKIITPENPEERGCQLSLFFHEKGRAVFEQLEKDGIIVDWREPNVIRVAPVPLYNSFEDVYRFGASLAKALK